MEHRESRRWKASVQTRITHYIVLAWRLVNGLQYIIPAAWTYLKRVPPPLALRFALSTLDSIFYGDGSKGYTGADGGGHTHTYDEDGVFVAKVCCEGWMPLHK